jgi:hypothetical protein
MNVIILLTAFLFFLGAGCLGAWMDAGRSWRALTPAVLLAFAIVAAIMTGILGKALDFF